MTSVPQPREGTEGSASPATASSGILAAARDYCRRGWAVVPVPSRSKNPGLRGWQNLRLSEADLPARFNGHPQNIGVLLGEPSGGLVDIDLDHPRCVALADQYLPPTPAVFGRPGKPRSHWLYRVNSPVASRKHKSKASGMLVELRSTGQQTIFPPSTHVCGEPIQWDDENAEPAIVDPGALLTAVQRLAAQVRVELGESPSASAAGRPPAFPPVPVDQDLPGGGAVQTGELLQPRLRCCLAALLKLDRTDHKDGSARLFAAACRCVEHDLTDEQALTVLGWYAQHYPFPMPWTNEQMLERVRDAEQKCTRGIARQPAPELDPVSGRRVPQAVTLVGLAEDAEFFHDDEQTYVSFAVNGHRETHPIRSRAVRNWLSQRFYEGTQRVPGAQALQDALGVLEGRARFEGPERPVALRIAEYQSAYWLDLADDAWQTVRIDEAGWRVVAADAAPVRFRRRRGMRALPMPVTGGSVEELRGFVNLQDEDEWALLVGWLVATLRPVGPHPILHVVGEQGSAKSTLCRILRALVDPNQAPLRSEPREARDLMIAATNSWVVMLDNLSGLPAWLSDALCRLATGGGFATRALYRDDEEIIFDALRPVVLNGITGVATRPDLLDRCITLALEPIDQHQRRTERELWAAFEAVRPRILGALLTAVSVALRRLSQVRLQRLPRMADFAVFATAAEPALEISDGAFLRAYDEDRIGAQVDALEGCPVAQAILGLVKATGGWKGTATELWRTLTEHADGISRASQDWPKSARGMGADLRRLAPGLRAAGVRVVIPSKKTGHDKKRAITLEQVEIERSAWSAQSAEAAPGSATGDAVRTIADRCPGEARGQWSAPSPLPESQTPPADRPDRADRSAPACSGLPLSLPILVDRGAGGCDEEEKAP